MTLDIKHLKVVKEDDYTIIAYCPFHKDNNRPNLQINKVGKYAGMYRCWACGATGSISGIKFVKREISKPVKIDWDKAARFYHSIANNGFQNKVYGDLMRLWSLRSKNTLSRMYVGWDGKAWTFPLKDNLFNTIGIQRILPDGRKRTFKHSRMGLLLPLHTRWYKPLYICEGVSDTATALDIGLNAIGKVCAGSGDDLIEDLLPDYLDVSIMADNDNAGIVAAEKLKTRLTNSTRCVTIIIPEEGNDLREFVELKGQDYVKHYLSKTPYPVS